MARLLRRLTLIAVLLRVRKVPLLLVLAAIPVFTIAAAPADANDTAIKIASYVLIAVAPFIGLAQLHFDGRTMVLISMGLAVVVALIAQFATGDLVVTDLPGSIGSLAEEFAKLWAITQGVFQLFKDSKTVGPLLTDKPVLAAPQSP